MSVFFASESVPAVLRQAEERRQQQRRSEADRRANALESYVHAVGGQAAAADGLGISFQAVSKALAAARRRATGEPPLAGILELDLPGCGAQVPTMQEWREMDAAEQRRAAERGVLVWGALAGVLGRLQRETHSAAEFLAAVSTGSLDLDYPEDAAEQPFLVGESDATAAGEKTDPSHALILAFADLAAALDGRRHDALRAVDWWEALRQLDGTFEG